MKLRTLNKMRKFCKMKGWRFGQLIQNLSADNDGDSFYMEDGELTRRFNVLYLAEKPIKKRGGYFKYEPKKTP